MTIITIGTEPREIFLEDFSWIQTAPEGTTAISRPLPSFHLERRREAATASLTILFTTFTEARNVSQLLAEQTKCTLTAPELGLDWNFRSQGTINIEPARIGNEIKAWRLTVNGVEQ